MASKHSAEKKSYERYLQQKRKKTQPPTRRRQAAAGQYRRLLVFALLIAVVSAVIILAQGEEFLLKEIQVTGSTSRSSSEIAAMSGLRLGMNILNVDQEAVKRNFSESSAVELKNIRIEMPDTVILEVRERSVCAAVNCVGVILLIDRDGYVLHRMSSMPANRAVPLISGMDARIDPHGKTIESGTEGQLQVMINVIDAIYEAGIQTEISEVNIEDVNSIYLISGSGIQVRIGDDENLDVKLRWMRAVLDALTADGTMSGVVDVSGSNNAVYSGK